MKPTIRTKTLSPRWRCRQKYLILTLEILFETHRYFLEQIRKFAFYISGFGNSSVSVW